MKDPAGKHPPLPDFEDSGEDHPLRWSEADKWRSEHVRPRARAPKIHRSDATDAGKQNRGGAGGDTFPETQPVCRGDEDFEEFLVKRFEWQMRHAFWELDQAHARKDRDQILWCVRLVAETNQHLSRAREAAIKLRKQSAEYVRVDVARGIVGRELAYLQTLLDTVGERCADKANPEHPEVAAAAINAAVDAVYEQMRIAGDAIDHARARQSEVAA